MGGSVFDDLAASCKATAASTCAELERAYAPLARDRSRKREMHELALKPTLRNAGNQKVRPERPHLLSYQLTYLGSRGPTC